MTEGDEEDGYILEGREATTIQAVHTDKQQRVRSREGEKFGGQRESGSGVVGAEKVRRLLESHADGHPRVRG